MSKNQVLSQNISDPVVALAVREYAQDRDALLARIKNALADDPAVRCAGMWGSFGRGDADDLSDLDFWAFVPQDLAGQMGARFYRSLMSEHPLLPPAEAPYNAPVDGGYISAPFESRHGIVQVDLYWQSLTRFESWTEVPSGPDRGAIRPVPCLELFNRLDEPMPPVLAVSGEPRCVNTLGPLEDKVQGAIGFAWLMFSIAAKYLARHPDSDMGLMLYPKPGIDETAPLIDPECTVGAIDWTVPDKPLAKVKLLRHVCRKVYALSEIAVAKCLMPRDRRYECLSRYLKLVSGILAR